MKSKRRPPDPSRRQMIAMPEHVQNGEDLLERQMGPFASGKRAPQGFGAEHFGRFGGGSSPVKTDYPVAPEDRGKLVVWDSDGRIAIAGQDYPPEAPLDGQIYARQSGDWVPVGVGRSGSMGDPPIDGRCYVRRGFDHSWQPLPVIISEAPADGQGYVRIGLNQGWAPAYTSGRAKLEFAPISTVSFPEAPADGLAYARRGWDHVWIPVATGAGVVEAPATGQVYVRRGSDESWQLALTEDIADSRYQPLTAIGPDPPNDPYPGEFWFDPANSQLFLWYEEGQTGWWIAPVGSPGPPGEPGPPGPVSMVRGPRGEPGEPGVGEPGPQGEPGFDAAQVAVSDEPPEDPIVGDLWYHPTSTRLSIWYEDDGPGRWIAPLGSAPPRSSGAITGQRGDRGEPGPPGVPGPQGEPGFDAVPVTVSLDPPRDPLMGDLWFKLDTRTLCIWVEEEATGLGEWIGV